MIRTILIALCLVCAVQPALAAGRGYLGVWFTPLPAKEKMTGVVVNKVFANSAAQRAGLKPGQIITKIDGIPVRDPRMAVDLVSENSAGEKISLTVTDRTGGGVRQSNVFAILAANPPSEFTKIMTAKPQPRLRRAPMPSTPVACTGPARTQNPLCPRAAAQH